MHGRYTARGRRPAIIALSATLVVMLLGPGAAHAARRAPKPALCQGGYYVLDGEPLVPGAGVPDGLVIDRGAVATSSGCPGTRASVFRAKQTRKASARGDELVVTWPRCGTLARVTLRARISADCATVSGTFKAKGRKVRRFTGRDGLPAGLQVPWGASALPPGAVYVSPAEFLDASRRPGFRLISPQQGAEDEAAAAAADAANQATLDAFVAAHPGRADFVSIGVDPNAPDLASAGDGNYRLTIYDRDGNGSDLVTMGPRYQRAVRAETIRTYPTQQNQLAIYAQRYAFAQANLDPALPSPDAVADRSADELAALNEGVAAQLPAAEAAAPLAGEDVPGAYPARCGLEIGAGDGTDASAVCTHATDGLWNTATWPLKYYATCVKNQAVRGTCVGFAITAGRELRAARKYERFINLSEQHLYAAAKQTFQPATYGDGLNGSGLLGQLSDAGYQQPFEQAWDYNPSNSRSANATSQTYMNSCLGYGGDQAAFCSDTAHQARIVCMQAGANVVCATQSAPAVGTTVRTTEQPVELWDAGDPITGLANVILALAVPQIPVVIGFDVVQSFDSPDGNGFVRFRPGRAKVCATDPPTGACVVKTDCECSRGGHSALAVGYLPESKLPQTAPKGTGGFLIIKNSWGCVGDGGYYYLPATWVRTFVHSARPVGDVEASAPLPDQPFDPSYPFDYRPVPPSIRIVQPAVGELFVAGQGVPLAIDGVDFQYDRYALLGQTRWSSNRQGELTTGVNAIATLIEGTHVITATYTGKTGAVATATTTVVVGPRPADLPPTPYFFDFTIVPGNQCPVPCDFSCILGFGQGSDPEDGLLTAGANVRWYAQGPITPKQLTSSGASVANQGKFLTCSRLCGGLFRFTLEVEDSKGQRAEARRELSTSSCVN